MENASKALLIAAAVLVVIILVAVGMKIYSSTTGTQKVATDTGITISDKTKDATDLASLEMNGSLSTTEDNIIKYLGKAYSSYQSSGSVGAVSDYIENNLKKYFKDNIKNVSEVGDKIIVKANIDGNIKKYELDKNSGNIGEHKYVDPFNYGWRKNKKNSITRRYNKIGTIICSGKLCSIFKNRNKNQSNAIL